MRRSFALLSSVLANPLTGKRKSNWDVFKGREERQVQTVRSQFGSALEGDISCKCASISNGTDKPCSCQSLDHRPRPPDAGHPLSFPVGGGNGGSAHFIFANLNGTISAWDAGQTAFTQVTTAGASYTGLASHQPGSDPIVRRQQCGFSRQHQCF
jgi:hypothetical protein